MDHLFALLPEELAALVACDPAEARRILAHVILGGADDLAPRHSVRRCVREAVERLTRRDALELVARSEDPSDGFVKYLFRSPDGALSEAVRIPLHRPGRFSLCLSSQVGCAMDCAFCATGRLGLTRHLEAWEMIAAFRAVAREGRISGAVFMGQGEPFHNYDEVIRAARILAHPCGGRMAARAISISTVGLVPAIRRYTRERHPYRLIVSLTSAIAERRRRLLPIAGRQDLEALAAALRDHASVTGERITIAWVLLGGINSGREEAAALADLLRGVPLRINLIDVNDARPNGFARATDVERNQFVDALQRLGAPIVRRYSGGATRHAACGMLTNVS
ncbi:MAG TPA: radical SAM protein [Polyangiaceae bacterium]|jgi:23S rRNA (adenine2503-C2)-methyltransferase|nr:radical SAM protein [Polyangiaceae bacterium]